MTVCKVSGQAMSGLSWLPRAFLPRRCRSKSVSEKCKQMERAHDETASSPHPSPPEEERERTSQTRSKQGIPFVCVCSNRMFTIRHIASLDVPELQPYRTMRHQTEHRDQGIFVAEGEKVVRRLLESDLKVISLLLPEQWVRELE